VLKVQRWPPQKALARPWLPAPRRRPPNLGRIFTAPPIQDGSYCGAGGANFTKVATRKGWTTVACAAGTASGFRTLPRPSRRQEDLHPRHSLHLRSASPEGVFGASPQTTKWLTAVIRFVASPATGWGTSPAPAHRAIHTPSPTSFAPASPSHLRASIAISSLPHSVPDSAFHQKTSTAE